MTLKRMRKEEVGVQSRVVNSAPVVGCKEISTGKNGHYNQLSRVEGDPRDHNGPEDNQRYSSDSTDHIKRIFTYTERIAVARQGQKRVNSMKEKESQKYSMTAFSRVAYIIERPSQRQNKNRRERWG